MPTPTIFLCHSFVVRLSIERAGFTEGRVEINERDCSDNHLHVVAGMLLTSHVLHWCHCMYEVVTCVLFNSSCLLLNITTTSTPLCEYSVAHHTLQLVTTCNFNIHAVLKERVLCFMTFTSTDIDLSMFYSLSLIRVDTTFTDRNVS